MSIFNARALAALDHSASLVGTKWSFEEIRVPLVGSATIAVISSIRKSLETGLPALLSISFRLARMELIRAMSGSGLSIDCLLQATRVVQPIISHARMGDFLESTETLCPTISGIYLAMSRFRASPRPIPSQNRTEGSAFAAPSIRLWDPCPARRCRPQVGSWKLEVGSGFDAGIVR